MVESGLEQKEVSLELDDKFSSYDNSISEESYDDLLTTPMIIVGTSPSNRAHNSNMQNIQDTHNIIDETLDNQSFTAYNPSLTEMDIYSKPQFTNSVIRPNYAPRIADNLCQGCFIF